MPASTTPIRRPRMTPDRERELLTVALNVLIETGYEALSMDTVATRARCSKATLYRLWQGKPQMIAAALRTKRPHAPSQIDTGTLRGDLVGLAEQLAANAQQNTALVAAMQHAVLTDEALAAAVRTSMLDPEGDCLARLIDRAVKRGELTKRPAAAEFGGQMLLSAVLNRPLHHGAVADSDYLARFIDHVLLPALRHS